MLSLFLEKYPLLKVCQEQIQAAVDLIIESYSSGNKLLACGNGGSAADCEHIIAELMKEFLESRPVTEKQQHDFNQYGCKGAFLAKNLQRPLPAISLVSSVGISTAYANDVAGELVFAQQIFGLGKANDILLALSTSGNSKNIEYALITAKTLGLKTIGMTGATGGVMPTLCDVCIKVPSDCTPDIQELHLPIYHYICKAVEQHFFKGI